MNEESPIRVEVPCGESVPPDSYHNVPLSSGSWLNVYCDASRCASVAPEDEADVRAYFAARDLSAPPQSREQESEQRPEPAKLAEQGEGGA